MNRPQRFAHRDGSDNPAQAGFGTVQRMEQAARRERSDNARERPGLTRRLPILDTPLRSLPRALGTATNANSFCGGHATGPDAAPAAPRTITVRRGDFDRACRSYLSQQGSPSAGVARNRTADPRSRVPHHRRAVWVWQVDTYEYHCRTIPALERRSDLSRQTPCRREPLDRLRHPGRQSLPLAKRSARTVEFPLELRMVGKGERRDIARAPNPPGWSRRL